MTTRFIPFHRAKTIFITLYSYKKSATKCYSFSFMFDHSKYKSLVFKISLPQNLKMVLDTFYIL